VLLAFEVDVDEVDLVASAPDLESDLGESDVVAAIRGWALRLLGTACDVENLADALAAMEVLDD
jgi:hypothetical protein